MEEVNPRLNSVTGGLTYSVAVIIFIAVSLIISLIISFAHLEEGGNAYVYLSYIASPIAIGACIASVLAYRKINFRCIFPVKCSPKYYVIGLLLIYGLLFSLSWLNDVSVKFFRLFGYVPRESESYFPDVKGGMIVPALLVIAVLPAFIEELLFRGAVLNSCENSMGSIRAIFIAGFCFSLFHGSPEQTVYQFVAGCAFAFIAVRSRSILPSVMMHFINNALIVILYACNCYDETGALIITDGGNIALTVTSAIAFVSAVLWLVFDKTPLKKCEKGGVKSFFVYASVGIAVLGLMWLLSLFGVGNA